MTGLVANPPTAPELAQVGRLLGMLGEGDWRWSLRADPGSPWLQIDCEAIVVADCPDPSPRFVLWRSTGHIYRVGPDGAVEDGPFLDARALHPQTREIRRLADDLDRYRGYVADQSDMERAVGVELRQLADRIIGDMAVQYIDKEHPVVRFPIFRCASCERATVSGLCGCQNPAPMRLDQDPTVAALVGQEILAACTYLVGACRRQLGRRARRRIHVALTNAEGAIAAATWMALPPSCPPSAEKPVAGESGDAFEA